MWDFLLFSTKQMKYIIHPFKAAVAAVTALFFLFIAVGCFVIHSILGVCVFLLLGFLYGYIFMFFGAQIVLDEYGVSRRLWGNTTGKKLEWSQIEEIGIANMKIIHNSGEKKRNGTLYFYFSKEKMNDEQRFQMCMNWPTPKQLFFQYDEKRYREIQKYWKKEIIYYNVNEQDFNAMRTEK